MPVASESYGPATPVRDSSRSIAVTATLSDELQVRFVVVPMFTVAAGAGVSCCTTGAVVSANVAVSENACEIVSGSGFVELVTSPVQPTNPQPAVGVAVSVTLEPNAYLGWSGLFATEPRPAIVTATVKLSVSMLAAMV